MHNPLQLLDGKLANKAVLRHKYEKLNLEVGNEMMYKSVDENGMDWKGIEQNYRKVKSIRGHVMMFDGDCYVPEEKDRLPPLSPVRSRIPLRRMVEDIQELRRPSHTIIEEFTRYSALCWALLCSLLSNDVLYILSIRSAFLRWLVTQSGLALSEGNYRSSHSTMKCDSSKARCLVVRRLIVRSLVSPFDLVPSTSYDVASPQSSLNCGDTCTTGTTTPKSICSSCTCGQS